MPATSELPKPGSPDETAPNRRPCELWPAREYGWAGLESPPPSEPGTDCVEPARFQMVIYRYGSGIIGPPLAWKVFEVCDIHLQRLYDLDDRIRSASEMSDIPTPSVRGSVP
jgi:hypothetical protein